MKNKPFRALFVSCAMLLGSISTASAMAEEAMELQQPGRLRVAVYAAFPPYSEKGKGIDVALGRELAKRLGLEAEVVEYAADEDMNDDLRNMVWKGHYLGTRPADVMLHVPVDSHLASNNDQVKIFAPYHIETVAVARNPQLVPPIAGSAARGLEVFTREKIGVEVRSLADNFLLSVLNGRLRENVVHFPSVAEAVAAMRDGSVAAVMAPRGEMEAALGKESPYPLTDVGLPELQIKGWALGMAVKADNSQLARGLATAMEGLQRDGTVAKIFAQHGVTVKTP
ncbi:MAG: transporter substrate-binding domain-containing protein [Zoogloeaceae bacterium]|nr:transporter substrate-binding domain-containing protein [Zoogloeaceae bacterium]